MAAVIKGSASKALNDLARSMDRAVDEFGAKNTERLKRDIRSETPRSTADDFAGGVHLADSYYIVGPRKTAHTITYRVKTDVEYAPWVEWDTGIHGPRGSRYRIAARRANFLHFYWKNAGKWFKGPSVMHPGSKGAHMFAKGADELERKLPARMETMVRVEARKQGFRVDGRYR